MGRKTKEDWLIVGMNILAEKGAAGLTIDVLLQQMGVTKGSFYHHFKNRREFTKELLHYWEEQKTLDIIRLSEEAKTPTEKIKLLTELSLEMVNANLEIAIRAWAIRDPVVKSFQERVDHQRLNYCIRLCQELTKDDEKSQVWGRLVFSVYIGAQQALPPIRGDQLRQLYGELQKLYGISE